MLLGIFMRGTGGSGKSAADSEAPAGQHIGYIAILGSALGYALLGMPIRIAVVACVAFEWPSQLRAVVLEDLRISRHALFTAKYV